MTPKPENPAPAIPLAPITAASHPITMTIDIGGSGLKAMLLDAKGRPVSQRQRVLTPEVPNPAAVLKSLEALRKLIGNFDRVSVGFPGVVKHGCTFGAFNLHPLWAGGFPLQAELEKRWKKPVRVGNDADVAGYGAIKGKGVELVLTLGTGLGGALFTNGHLCPGLEIGHHIWRKRGMTYEDYIGRRGLDRFGKKEWNKLVQAAIKSTELLFNWDHLYLGGGNNKKLDFLPPKNVSIVSNEQGLLGGVYLWRDQA
jgi:polyphosphate glucokinase